MIPPSFGLGGQPYVLTMLSDVEFLEDYGRYRTRDGPEEPHFYLMHIPAQATQ